MRTSDSIAKTAIRELAAELGLRSVGFAEAKPPARGELLVKWLREGKAGTMSYLHRQAERKLNPARVLAGARSVIGVVQPYFSEPLPHEIRTDPSRGLIASYAWGLDYHTLLLDKIKKIAELVDQLYPGSRSYSAVDTAPIMERDHAERAGLGFIGKNTMLIMPRSGSLSFLGEILTTAEISADEQRAMPTCGSCTRCLETCPTHAFPAEYVLDSTLCISYLTIEFRGIIPRELRAKMGNHIFGCDDCQTCCPWNMRFADKTEERLYWAEIDRKAPKLERLASMNEAEYREMFRETAILRASFTSMQRNVAVALGNWRSVDALESLSRLSAARSEIVRSHAAWAIGNVGTATAKQMLMNMQRSESDLRVQEEIQAALSGGLSSS